MAEASLPDPSPNPSPSRFWHNSLHAMHPSLRIRYIPYFALAETLDRSFDAVLDLWSGANARALKPIRMAMR